jgi:hypothetical protein
VETVLAVRQQQDTISGLCPILWSEIGFPSFSAAVTSFYEARFGLYRNSGNRQDRMTLSSVWDKPLM